MTDKRELSKDEKTTIAKLRSMLSDTNRNALDAISASMIEHGYEQDTAMFTPYVIFILGMQYATETGAKVIESDVIKSDMYVIPRDNN